MQGLKPLRWSKDFDITIISLLRMFENVQLRSILLIIVIFDTLVEWLPSGRGYYSFIQVFVLFCVP